eukprot:5153739-Lingulodinium_polyedra.AAC.1
MIPRTTDGGNHKPARNSDAGARATAWRYFCDRATCPAFDGIGTRCAVCASASQHACTAPAAMHR